MIINGDEGQRPVDAADILVNGKSIAGPDDFKHKVERFTRNVELAEKNSIVVRRRGAPDSEIRGVIQPAKPAW